jgi:hypothetical protein
MSRDHTESMNRFQFAFLASFVLVFSSLYLISQFVGGWLRASGYDISELILIGLPKDGKGNTWMSHATGQVGLAAEFMNNFHENGYTHVLALVFAVVSSVFIFVKFAYGSEFVHSGWSYLPLLTTCRTKTCVGSYQMARISAD